MGLPDRRESPFRSRRRALSDLPRQRMKPATAMAISSGIGCLLVVTLWGFGGEVGLPLLAPFAITFGLAAGGFSSMWSQCAHGIAGPDKELQTLLVAGE